MLRLDMHRSGSTRVDIRVSGRLADTHSTELAAAVSPHAEAGRTVFLDLSGLTGLDHPGVSLLLHLADAGVRLAHCPPFLTLWLRAEQRSRNRDESRIRESRIRA